MDQVLKSFQITLLDILAILFPGAIWLFLIFTGLSFFADYNFYASPVSTWDLFLRESSSEANFLVIISFIIMSYLLGYVFKPFSMVWAELIYTRLTTWNKWKLNKDLMFPYLNEFKDKEYIISLSKKIDELIGGPSSELFGSGLFKVCQTMIRLKSPILREEIERRGIEVRLIGSLFLASILSIILSILSLMFVKGTPKEHYLAIFCVWITSSFILIFLLGAGFRRLRKREVGYAYMHTLILLTLEDQQKNESKINKQ